MTLYDRPPKLAGLTAWVEYASTLDPTKDADEKDYAEKFVERIKAGEVTEDAFLSGQI